jgi:acetylornithine deacetylase
VQNLSHNILIHPKRVLRTLKELVDIYSPSGKEEEIQKYLYEYCDGHYLEAVKQRLDDERYNLLILPSESPPRLWFVGHVDTVTAYDLEALEVREENGHMVGLGTADMKGGCAAMLECFTALREQWPKEKEFPPVALALVVGEEEDGDGAQLLADSYHISHAVLGEPTNLHPCTGHYGYLEVFLNTSGKRVHSSLADQSDNPIEWMLHLLLLISEKIKEQPLIFNIRDLESRKGGFVVPDKCDAWLDIHLPPHHDVQSLKSFLLQLLGQAKEKTPYMQADMEFSMAFNGYKLSLSDPVWQKVRRALEARNIPWEEEMFRSHSDANILWLAGGQPLILGPGQLEYAHAAEERVAIPQVLHAAQLYVDIVWALFG